MSGWGMSGWGEWVDEGENGGVRPCWLHPLSRFIQHAGHILLVVSYI